MSETRLVSPTEHRQGFGRWDVSSAPGTAWAGRWPRGTRRASASLPGLPRWGLSLLVALFFGGHLSTKNWTEAMRSQAT